MLIKAVCRPNLFETVQPSLRPTSARTAVPQRSRLEAMRTCSLWIGALLFMGCLHSTAQAAASLLPQDTLVRETSTGKVFPTSVYFVQNEGSYSLSITGLAVRTRFFFKIYCLAHYMQDPPTGSTGAILQAIMSDSQAKQVTMHFVRDVSADRIQHALLDGFQRNTTDSELAVIQPFVEQFTRAIYRDVKEDDQFVIRWLPGGTTTSVFEGREVTNITSAPFAKVLWSIWFGEHSVVNRDHLLRFLVVES